jgi:nucleotide-binding universal stress UspA family protein
MGGRPQGYDVVEALERRISERQRTVTAAFQDFCAREQLAVSGQPVLGAPSAELITDTGEETFLVAEHGRAADLIVISGGPGGLGILKAALLGTGRPVLIAPAKPYGPIAGTIAIAWKNTTEAARAVTAARPFIEMARKVVILSVEEKIELAEQSCDSLRKALSWHNPDVSVQRLQADGRSPVEALLAAVDGQADLLVMGGYGHSRLREFVFGGFTRRILEGIGIPVLMAH